MKKINYLILLLTLPFLFLGACKKESDTTEKNNAELIQKLKAVSDSVLQSSLRILWLQIKILKYKFFTL